MDVFTFIILIVIVSCGASVWNNHIDNKRKLASRKPDESVQEELDDLRKRVEVLEAIVTDEKYHLEKEIDRLEAKA